MQGRGITGHRTTIIEDRVREVYRTTEASNRYKGISTITTQCQRTFTRDSSRLCYYTLGITFCIMIVRQYITAYRSRWISRYIVIICGSCVRSTRWVYRYKYLSRVTH
ncbi:hypothetical protein D3C80_1358830 [compost metagenome]